ncbi:MAG: hypothetical protein QXR49_01885 [Sulfolobales archaeon]
MFNFIVSPGIVRFTNLILSISGRNASFRYRAVQTVYDAIQ